MTTVLAWDYCNILKYNIMKILFISTTVVALMLTGPVVIAQKTGKQVWQYAGMVQGGIMNGSTTVAYVGQTVHGLQKNSWFTGIGVGYDNYGISGIPLVLHGQKSFTNNKGRPFAYAQTGLQFAVKTGRWKEKNFNGKNAYDLRNGFVGELGAGYQLMLGKTKKNALVFSAGYSYKYNKADYSYPIWTFNNANFAPGGDYELKEIQSYHYRRIAIKAGIMF